MNRNFWLKKISSIVINYKFYERYEVITQVSEMSFSNIPMQISPGTRTLKNASKHMTSDIARDKETMASTKFKLKHFSYHTNKDVATIIIAPC